MSQAQETAMEALNLPSASNVDKLARRLRSISQRLHEIDDGLRQGMAGASRGVRGVREAGQEPREAAGEVGERVRGALHDLTTGEKEDLRSEIDRLRRRVDGLERELKERAPATRPEGRGSASTAQRGKEQGKT